MFLSDNTFPLFKDMCDSLTWLVSLSASMNHAGRDSKLLLMLSTTLLCLPKSKLNFKLKLRCHLFSGSVISFSDCRSVTPKSLYPFSVSQRLVRKVFALAYNIAPVLSFWSHIYKLLYALDPWTQWLTFWFSVMPRYFLAFCTFVPVLPSARYDPMTCPFLSWKDSCISFKKHFQQYLLWNLPDLCQGKHFAPEYFESKYPKRCVVILYLYVCLLYLM